ncbi:AfsR/SARP family transcriptional regulator [Crossiella cryophila]|uniref:DNA-binding SARP family transcriptional activator n=1 Tax=Crossiella cryophila TaxID=43355 RepID=A0A7W7CA80_9PSEU|nr:BTAD domain-containing putative transcriptional regulator [Crossiella cryophila]MBB4677425.1 DNA-binding SARP family transcriptional activator [Crossiella cryophila]
MKQGLAFGLLGPVRAWHDGAELNLGSPQQRLTLATLLLADGRAVPVEEIAAALWGESVPRAARGTIRTYVQRLRRVLETGEADPVIVSTGGGYAVRVPEDAVDLGRFRRDVRAAEAARARGETRAAAELYKSAVEEWDGEPLAGLHGETAEAERARLRRRRLGVVEELAGLELDLGRCPDLVERLAAEAQAEPLRERLHELLMLALYRSGRQAEALAAYDKLRALLAEELGVDPGPTVRELHYRILRADPELLAGPREQPRIAPAAVPVVTPAQLPPDLPAFIGRAAELAALTMPDAPDPSCPAVAVVHGTAGVGKTTFAVRWAHQVAADFPDGQLYVDLRGFEPEEVVVEPREAVWGLLDALGVPTTLRPDRLDALTALYRSVLAEKRCLILLDNARDTAQVLPLLPGNPNCFVLVTSRVELSGLVAATGAHTVALDILSEEDATAFLARRLGRARVAAEPEAVRAIIAACARLPLALAVVCARAAYHPAFSLAAVAEELEAARGGLDAFTGADSRSDVRSVLSWSYRALSVPAARLFRLLSFHPSTSIDLRAAASLAGLPVARAQALFRELTAAHLVAEIAPGRFHTHDLLRAYALELVAAQDSAADQRAVLRRGLEHHLHTAHAAARILSAHQDLPAPGDPDPAVSPRGFASYEQALDWFILEHGVLIGLTQRAATTGFERQAWMLAWMMRHYLDWAGHWRDLETVNRTALRAATDIGDTLGVAYARRGIARIEAHHGRFGPARTLLAESLTGFTVAGDTLARAYTHRQAIGVRQLEGDYAGALEEATAALALFRAAGSAVGEGAGLLGLAANQTRLGRPEDALVSGARALDLLMAAGDLYDLALTLEVLGRACAALGRFAESAGYRERGIELSKSMANRGDFVTSLLHRMVTSALIYLSEARHQAGHHDRANAALREALTRLHDELSEPYLVIGGGDGATEDALRDVLATLAEFLAEPEEGQDWYERAGTVLHKVASTAEELGLGAYLTE